MNALITIIALLIFVLLLLCREYYKLNHTLDSVLNDNTKLRRENALMTEYLHYYIQAVSSGIEEPFTLSEYKRINKL